MDQINDTLTMEVARALSERRGLVVIDKNGIPKKVPWRDLRKRLETIVSDIKREWEVV